MKSRAHMHDQVWFEPYSNGGCALMAEMPESVPDSFWGALDTPNSTQLGWLQWSLIAPIMGRRVFAAVEGVTPPAPVGCRSNAAPARGSRRAGVDQGVD